MRRRPTKALALRVVTEKGERLTTDRLLAEGGSSRLRELIARYEERVGRRQNKIRKPS